MPDTDPEIVRLEAAAARAWPATHTARTSDGWLLRATPELDRGRNNNALPPQRPIGPRELSSAIERITRFAAQHGTRAGIQVSPLPLHAGMQTELAARGWARGADVLVMTAPTERVARIDLRLIVARHADPEWSAAWAACDPGQDHDGHHASVFSGLGALEDAEVSFARIGTRAVAIAVQDDGLLGLFSVATAASARRQGLGAALVRGLAAWSDAPLSYLLVDSENTGGVAFWTRLGFTERYRYAHHRAPR